MILSLLFSLFLLSTAQNCSYIQTGNKYIDLTPLIGREITTKDSFSNYKATICINAYADCGSCNGPAGYCQYTDQWADCIGKFSAIILLTGGKIGVELLYDNGDWGNVGRVRIECDPTTEISNTTFDQNPKNMVIRSKYACPVDPTPPTPPPPNVTDCKKIPDSSGSGAIYDLTPIIGRQIFWQNPQALYKASVCLDTWKDCGVCGGPAGFCQYTNTWAECVGKFSLAVGLPGSSGVELFYDNGDWGYSGRVRLLCDPTVEMSQPTFDTSPYFVTVRTKYACPCSWVCVPPY